MPIALIYLSEKSSMQSGKAKAGRWILEKRMPEAKSVEGVMGWQSASGTSDQVKLYFPSSEEAQAYAAQHGLDVVILSPEKRSSSPKSYADNFTKGLRF